MKEFAYTLNLKDDAAAVAAYKEYHRNVWPEVARMQRKLGVTKIRIFLHGRQMFLYIQAGDDYDPAKAAEEYLKEPRIVEWERLMQDKFQEQLPGSKPNEWWQPMEVVYALD